MLVLGIETSCDETACSLVKGGKVILSNQISSQQEVHRKFGGVFPEIASRMHVEAVIPVLDAALKEACVRLDELELVAVAKGPGLIGALLIGLNVAKALSFSLGIPFIGVNHVEAHLYAAMMQVDTLSLPAIGVVVSGGHTFILEIQALGNYKLLGTTVDDAVGEAFDKVAKLLDLPYPGGPEIEKLAREGNPLKYDLNAGHVKGRPLDFSFSGLKTSVLYRIQELTSKGEKALSLEQKQDIAASFQKAALDAIVKRVVLAAKTLGARSIFLGGGVSCNQKLREELKKNLSFCDIYFPPKELCLDNAAMIAGLGYHRYQMQGKGDGLDLEPMTRIPF